MWFFNQSKDLSAEEPTFGTRTELFSDIAISWATWLSAASLGFSQQLSLDTFTGFGLRGLRRRPEVRGQRQRCAICVRKTFTVWTLVVLCADTLWLYTYCSDSRWSVFSAGWWVSIPASSLMGWNATWMKWRRLFGHIAELNRCIINSHLNISWVSLLYGAALVWFHRPPPPLPLSCEEASICTFNTHYPQPLWTSCPSLSDIR